MECFDLCTKMPLMEIDAVKHSEICNREIGGACDPARGGTLEEGGEVEEMSPADFSELVPCRIDVDAGLFLLGRLTGIGGLRRTAQERSLHPHS